MSHSFHRFHGCTTNVRALYQSLHPALRKPRIDEVANGHGRRVIIVWVWIKDGVKDNLGAPVLTSALRVDVIEKNIRQ
jgi:hypothetical protein